MAAVAAKQVLYHPSLPLLPKRRDDHSPITTSRTTSTTPTATTPNHRPPRGAPTLTVTLPFNFSTRLSKKDAKRALQSASSGGIRRTASRPTPGPTPVKAPTPRTTSLPRLGPGQQARSPHATPRSKSSQRQQTPSGRGIGGGGLSNRISRSTATPFSGSEARRTSSGFAAEEASQEENAGMEEGVEGEGEEGVQPREEGEGSESTRWVDREVVLSPEEERERRLNEKKCQRWLQGLPDRFSSMHVVQHVVYSGENK